MKNDNGNIILHQILREKSTIEIIPYLPDSSLNVILSLYNNELSWIPYNFIPGNNIVLSNINGSIKIDVSINNIIDNKIKDTNIYYKNDNIGIGRLPLKTYKLDIAVPENTLMTALHVGDGKYGFSMGNGTNNGFIPEIIGMGSDEYDTGLYLLGKAGNNNESDIPLVIIDGRSNNNSQLKNRPIFGVTSGEYNTYKFIVNNNGYVGIGKNPIYNMLEVSGNVLASDFLIDSSISFKQIVNNIIILKDIIDKQKKQIDILSEQIKNLSQIKID